MAKQKGWNHDGGLVFFFALGREEDRGGGQERPPSWEGKGGKKMEGRKGEGREENEGRGGREKGGERACKKKKRGGEKKRGGGTLDRRERRG